MLRRLLAVLVGLLSLLAVRAAHAAGDDKAPTIDLYTIGAGDYFYARFGHTLLCVRPPGAKIEDGTATCYDYGVPDREDFFHIGWDAVRDHVAFVPVIVAEKIVLDFFKGQGRSLERQHLPLMPDEAARLAKRLQDDVDHRVGYAYHPYWRNCTTALRDHLDAVTNGRLHPGPFTPAPGKFRELMEEGLSGRLPELTLMALVLGSPENNRAPTGWESMYLPINLRDGVRDRLGAPIEKLADRQAIILPTSRAIGRVVLFILAIVLFGAVRLAARRKRLRAGAWIVGGVLGFLGAFIGVVAALVVWPEIAHNWGLLVLLPTDFALPFLMKRKKLVVGYARARVALAIVLGLLELVGVVSQPLLPLVALVVLPFGAFLGALRAEEEGARSEATDRAPSPAQA